MSKRIKAEGKLNFLLPFNISYTGIAYYGIFKWGEKETSQNADCTMVNWKAIGLFSRCANPFDLSTTKFQFWLAIIMKATWEAGLSAYSGYIMAILMKLYLVRSVKMVKLQLYSLYIPYFFQFAHASLLHAEPRCFMWLPSLCTWWFFGP